MANHKSSKKRILVTAKKNAVNTARRSAVKTENKKALKYSNHRIVTHNKCSGHPLFSGTNQQNIQLVWSAGDESSQGYLYCQWKKGRD